MWLTNSHNLHCIICTNTDPSQQRHRHNCCVFLASSMSQWSWELQQDTADKQAGCTDVQRSNPFILQGNISNTLLEIFQDWNRTQVKMEVRVNKHIYSITKCYQNLKILVWFLNRSTSIQTLILNFGTNSSFWPTDLRALVECGCKSCRGGTLKVHTAALNRVLQQTSRQCSKIIKGVRWERQEDWVKSTQQPSIRNRRPRFPNVS